MTCESSSSVSSVLFHFTVHSEMKSALDNIITLLGLGIGTS